jgi:methionyl-tRNA formyltransferase
MKAIFFGMECRFSRPTLAALLAVGIDVRAVVVPRPRSVRAGASGAPIRRLEPPRPARGLALPAVSTERSILGLAGAASVPVFEVGRLAHEETLAVLRDPRPDVIVVACFPRLLPPALLDLPRHGALNVHPSLLPAYRGPQPLFWIFHDGLEHAGVTVHLMDSGADTGDIMAQQPLALPDGISYAGAEQRCAEVGARLVVEAARGLDTGTLARRPQPGVGISYAPAPRPEDFVVAPDWSARRAFNFTRGMADRHG